MNYLRGSRDVKGAGQLQSMGSTDALTAPLRNLKVRQQPCSGHLPPSLRAPPAVLPCSLCPQLSHAVLCSY